MFINYSGKQILSKKLKKIDASDVVPDFPVLSEDYLWSFTFGVYQGKHVFSYMLEHLDEDGGYDIFVGKTTPNIIQGKKQSRHESSKSYYLWVQFDSKDELDPINSGTMYYKCKSRACLVGSCAHVASPIWYIGIQRLKDMSLNTQTRMCCIVINLVVNLHLVM